MTEIFLNLMIDTKPQIQEAQKTLSTINTQNKQTKTLPPLPPQQKQTTCRCAIFKLKRIKDRENLDRGITYLQRNYIRLLFRNHISDRSEIVNVLKEKHANLEFCVQKKISFKSKGKLRLRQTNKNSDNLSLVELPCKKCVSFFKKKGNEIG